MAEQANVRSFLVGGKIQNTKLDKFPVLYFVFCILSLSIVVVDRIQNRLEMTTFRRDRSQRDVVKSVFSILSRFFVARQNTKSRQNSLTILSFGPVLSRDKIQNWGINFSGSTFTEVLWFFWQNRRM